MGGNSSPSMSSVNSSRDVSTSYNNASSPSYAYGMNRYFTKTDSKEPERKARRGIVLGKKETASTIIDQLKKEGEITTEAAPSAREEIHPEVVNSEPFVISFMFNLTI